MKLSIYWIFILFLLPPFLLNRSDLFIICDLWHLAQLVMVYTAFMDELTEALGYDKEVWSEEAASIEAKVNVAVSEYEKAAYIEGMKLGARLSI